MQSDYFTIISIVLGVSTFTAIIYSVIITKQTASQKILLEYLKDYSSPKMHQYLSIMSTFKSIYRNFHNGHLSKIEYQNAVNEIHIARRYIKHYFFNAKRLRNSDFMDENTFIQICSQYGLLLFEIIEPIESELGLIKKPDKDMYDELRPYLKFAECYKETSPEIDVVKMLSGNATQVQTQ